MALTCARHRQKPETVRRVKILLQNPAAVSLQEYIQMNGQRCEELKKAGHDGAIAHGQCPWSSASADFFVVFTPSGIGDEVKDD